MSTTSGGDMQQQQPDNSVTTVYNGDRTVTGQRVSPPSSSNGDSGFDNSNNESTAGDAKLIIDVPDFSKNMETPRTGIDNPSFETDKTDVPKHLTNGHNGTVNQENGRHEKDKMAEAVNLELINMKPFAKSMNGQGNGVPTKKKETAVNMNDTYDDYFIPVNEHKKYMRGGEKLYVTKDKRDMNQSKKPLVCWVFGLILLASAVTIAILASTGVIFSNDTLVESRNFMENKKIAGFGDHHGLFSSVSPPPNVDSSIPFSPPTTDMSGIIVPRTVQGEIVIDNLQFSSGLANKSSADFVNLASSIESELKNALFKEQTFNGASDSIHVKVYEFASGSVVAKYRIGWEYKDDNESQDVIDADTLKNRLDAYLRDNDEHLYNYSVPIHSLRSEHVVDKCKTENGKCSHFCSYDYVLLDFVCSCPGDLILSENMKDCKRADNDNEDPNEFTFSIDGHDPNRHDGSFDTELGPGSESESKPEPEPEAKAEPEPSSESESTSKPEAKAEPEPSLVPAVKADPVSSSEPEAKAEPEPSSEPEAKVDPEPSSEPEAKTEPEPSSEPGAKAEPEPKLEPVVKADTESSSEPETIAELEPSSEPEAKAEPEPSTEPEAKAEPEPKSEPAVKSDPEPSSEPEAKAEPEPKSEPAVKSDPEPSSEPEAKAEPQPSSEPESKVEPEPDSKPADPNSESEDKTKPEPSSEPEVKAEPEPITEPKSIIQQEFSSESEVKAEPEPNSKSSSTENFESLSDVDISSEIVSSEHSDKPNSSSTEKSNPSIEQTDREAKSHADDVFSHEIKPKVTYSVSAESEFETKTESLIKINQSSGFSFGDVNFNESEGPTTLSTISEDEFTTLPSTQGSPKLPSDFEVLETENGAKEEETKTESNTPMINESMETKSENKSTSDFIPESQSKIPLDQVTEWPDKSMSESSTSKEEMSSTSREFDNISKESVTEVIGMTTMPPTIEQESIVPTNNLINQDSSENKQADDLSSLEKTNISDTTKKLQSLTSLEEQLTNLPHVDVMSTSTQINTDNFNENNPSDEHDPLGTVIHQSNEENVSENLNEDEMTSALDFYQKPESKKKDKKTTKNPEFYLTESGFTKRNKTKTEKENKKNPKSDFMDVMISSIKCEEGQFQCVNGTTKDGSYCIKVSSRCDSIRDCTDNSDEYDCVENACYNNFQCKSGECLQRNLVCNNITDCADGSDEQSCDLWKCTANENQCTGGQCLPTSYFCDGKSDCNDHSDELQCNSSCNGFQCPDSFCLSNTLRCNGVNDCSGGEDEQNCECSADEFKCKTGSECIPKTQVCNNVAQCPDRSDEWQCVQLDGLQLLAKKEGEVALKVCSTNWSDQWSNFVCQSLGFTEMKTANFRPSEPTENATTYLKLKDDSSPNNFKSLTGSLELSTAPCDTVEIKCSIKHLCGDFGGKDPLSMEMWPSVIYLQNTKTHKSCTSSLVKRNWLLSSYSCVHSIDDSLSADQWEAVSSKSRVANESNSTKRPVSRIISHPGIKFEKLRYFNDTVLVELGVPYDLSDEVNTICLPEKITDDKQPCVTASWSYESPGVFKQFSRLLTEPLMETDACNSTKNLNGFLIDREICVASGEMEASNMEIGSPLMCLAENGLWQLQGMLSYRGGYGRSSKPTLYNAVVDSVMWAENTIASGV